MENEAGDRNEWLILEIKSKKQNSWDSAVAEQVAESSLFAPANLSIKLSIK